MERFIEENARTFVRVRTPEPERLADVLAADGLPPERRPARADGSVEVSGAGAERIGELAAAHRLVLHELSPQRASLEEAFMRLTHESVEYQAHDTPPRWGG
jgi:ABC-2 type transport system ATP-binding protein